MERNVKVIDATLREGAQSPGVHWTADASAAVARGLDRLGVDMVECGHPAIGPDERDRIRAVLEAGLRAPVLVHARATPEDVDAVVSTRAPWVGLFLGVNPVSRRARVRKPFADLLDQIRDVVGRAKSAGLHVRFTLEDASRTDAADAIAALGVALEAGADRLCWADTVGVAEPAETGHAIARLRTSFPGAEIEVHLHDDRGLAVANALAAVDSGATWVSTSVNGLGERCGIADLAMLLVNLACRGQRPWPNGETIQELARLVAERSGVPLDARHPITGAYAFSHTARLHVRAMRRDPESYSWIDPARVGRAFDLGHEGESEG